MKTKEMTGFVPLTADRSLRVHLQTQLNKTSPRAWTQRWRFMHPWVQINPQTICHSVDEIEIATHESSSTDVFVRPAMATESRHIRLRH